jgi:SAM-dependent methyltransferase
MPLTVLELPSSETLDEEAYLAANHDVRAAGMSARYHFEAYGAKEGRRQFSRQYLDKLAAYRADKFRRFEEVLDINATELSKGTFPITVGAGHFSLDQYAGESANAPFGPFEEVIIANPDKLYMDVGCGFRNEVHVNCLYLEVYPSRTADLIVEPSCFYPIKSNSLDGIGCFAVLEHTRKPWLVVEEMQRMLRPGGKVFIDWPFLQPIHGFPSHFFNATREGLRSLFEDNGFVIETITTGIHQSPAYTVNWILRDMLARLPEGAVKEAFTAATVGSLAQTSPHSEFWMGILGQLSEAAISEFACGNWMAATKASR